jgi:hypothetical protein
VREVLTKPAVSSGRKRGEWVEARHMRCVCNKCEDSNSKKKELVT